MIVILLTSSRKICGAWINLCAHIELSLKCLNNDIEEAERRGVGLNDLLGEGWFRTQQTELARVLFGEQIENASMLFKLTDRPTDA
jgi:hypothetical protein